jgi:hypothetical protein
MRFRGAKGVEGKKVSTSRRYDRVVIAHTTVRMVIWPTPSGNRSSTSSLYKKHHV